MSYFRFHILYFKFQISDFRLQISDFRIQASNLQFLMGHRHHDPTLCHRVHSWVWFPGFGVLGLDSWAWIPGLGVLRLGSRAWIPGFRLLARTLMKTLSKPMQIEPILLSLWSPPRSSSGRRGKAARKPVLKRNPFISWRAHCGSHYRGRVDWKRFL